MSVESVGLTRRQIPNFWSESLPSHHGHNFLSNSQQSLYIQSLSVISPPPLPCILSPFSDVGPNLLVKGLAICRLLVVTRPSQYVVGYSLVAKTSYFSLSCVTRTYSQLEQLHYCRVGMRSN